LSVLRASVIIRSKDEEAGIGGVLELLAKQTMAGQTEIIVVDSGSSDDTVGIAREAGARVVEIPASTFTFGDSLNRGCAEAQAPVAIALSAHAFPPDERWLERLIAPFEDPLVASASGHADTLVRDLALAEREPFWGYSNAAGAFRMDLWRRRAFRPDMPGTEDKEWSWWWLRRGFLHVTAPDLFVVHDHGKDPIRDQYLRARREWIGFGMYLELAPYRLSDLISEWWRDQDGYRSPRRARLSHRRAARLLGKYAGQTRRAMGQGERDGEAVMRRVRADAVEGVATPEAPLRIAVMIDEFPTRSETFVVSEVQQLRLLGHLVRVLAVERSGTPDWALAGGVRATFVTDETSARKLLDLAWLLVRHPWRCARDLLSRRAWRDEEKVPGLRALAGRARRLHAGREQHLHVHFAMRSALEAMRLGRILGLPYSVTAHAWDIYLDPRNLAIKLESAAFATSGCDYTVGHLRSLVSPAAARRIHRIVMGVDSDRFRRTTPLPGGRTVIAVGRLVEKKGFVDLVEAVAVLEPGNGVERAVVVGDGPLRDALEARVAELGLSDVVDMRGALDGDQIRAALESADVLVMPSVIARDGDRDSMPVAVKEAMAMELMVIGTDILGLPEMIDDTRGRLVSPAEPESLARAIEELLDLPSERRTAIGAAGRAWVVQHANVATESHRLATLIRAAVTDFGDPHASSSR
jgi:colanic acid/amylovoran biosynthesis glycosyltransferase